MYMQWFHNLKLSAKITCFVFFMAIFISIVGFTGYTLTKDASKSLNDQYNNNLLPVRWLNQISANIREAEAAMFDYLNPANTDNAKAQKEIATINDRMDHNNELWDRYRTPNLSAYEKEEVAQYDTAIADYRNEIQKTITIAQSGKKAEAYAYYTNIAVPKMEQVNTILYELSMYNAKQARLNNEGVNSKNNRAIQILIVIVLASILLTFTIGVFFARFTAKRLIAITDDLHRVAQGDLTVADLKMWENDEIGQIGKDLNQMVHNFRDLLKQVSTSADHVASSSEELTASAEQSAQAANQVASSIAEVAKGAERQLSSINETSVVVDQMKESIHNVVTNGSIVNSLTESTANASKNGTKAVDDTINQMAIIEKTVIESAKVVTELGEQSKEIGQIVDAISGIAGQTNLLALNAAIEAARAGEQGRGFAVVAEEVRRLAEQSQEAAQRISSLIQEIQSKTDKAVVAMNEGTREVKVGTEVVASAGNLFKQIAELIAQISSQGIKTSDYIQQLESGSKRIVDSVSSNTSINEEAAGHTQNVSAAAEEQLASMEEIAASSRSLAKMAGDLQVVIHKFKI